MVNWTWYDESNNDAGNDNHDDDDNNYHDGNDNDGDDDYDEDNDLLAIVASRTIADGEAARYEVVL